MLCATYMFNCLISIIHLSTPVTLAFLLFLSHISPATTIGELTAQKSLECSSPRYYLGLLPHLLQITQISTSQWEFPWPSCLKLQFLPMPTTPFHFSYFIFSLPNLTPPNTIYNSLLLLFLICLIFCLAIECHLHEYRSFCLFCSLIELSD